MTTTVDIMQALDENDHVAESYVLVREIFLYLKISDSDFSPRIRIKIYQSNVLTEPFHFDVSHHVHTPVQGAPYRTSVTSAPSEKEAIRRAIDTTRSYIVSAINEGHMPRDSWLKKNDDF